MPLKLIESAMKNPYFERDEEEYKKQIAMGIESEKEHEDIYNIFKELLGDKMPFDLNMYAQKIAEAHLKEIPDYYTHLLEMEKKYKPEQPAEAAPAPEPAKEEPKGEIK